MSVIIGRALPDVRDGLKPVHRRILYAHARARPHLDEALSQVREDRRRSPRKVSSARQFVQMSARKCRAWWRPDRVRRRSALPVIYRTPRAVAAARSIRSIFLADGHKLGGREVFAIDVLGELAAHHRGVRDRPHAPGSPTSRSPRRLTWPTESFIIFQAVRRSSTRPHWQRFIPDGGTGLPDGQISHTAGPSSDGWTIVAIHDSRESWERFRDQILVPALQKGIEGGFASQPQQIEFDVYKQIP